jgi:Spy/CpxP family protein refolding chaperone
MQAEPAKKHSKLKLILAGVGVVYLVGAGMWAGQAYWKSRTAGNQPNMAAHPERAGEMMVDREIERYSGQLGLSDAQKRQVRDIVQKAGVTNVPPVQAMQGMMEVQKKVREILTPEQLEKMDKAQNDRMGKFADRMVDRLKKEVGISDEQAQGIRNIMNEANPMKAGADNSAPMPQRFMQTRERIRGLLTPEQQEKFDKMPGPGGGRMGGMLRRFMPGGGQPPQEEEN